MLAIPWRRLAAFGLNLVVVAVLRDSRVMVAVLRDRVSSRQYAVVVLRDRLL